jgi:hypothetical protein
MRTEKEIREQLKVNEALFGDCESVRTLKWVLEGDKK